MYISFLFALVIFHHIALLQSLQQCNSSNDCYGDIGEIRNASSGLLWRCCTYGGQGCESFSSVNILRCECRLDEECHRDEKCHSDLYRCVAARKCVKDSDCYRIGEGIVSWRCCQMDKRCSLKRDKEKTKWSRCECSSSDDCLSNEICYSRVRGVKPRCYTPDCKEDSDCGAGKECTNDGVGGSELSCQLTSAAFLTAIMLPLLSLSLAPLIWLAVYTIRRKRRERRARSRTAVRAPQHNRPRAARGGRATTSQSTGTSTHNDNTVVEEQRRPRLRPPTTELQSASSSSHNGSAVTVELRPTPTAPPLIPEEAMDVTIPSYKEKPAGIAVSSAATPGFSGSFAEPPPPSYEEVMRNSSYLERLA